MKANLRKHLTIIGINIALVMFSSQVMAASYANPELLVETAQLAEMMDKPNVRVVDARSKNDYKKGHIP
jgi:3-mercaptopyruvate sulfurtransferase SseA